MSEPIPKPVKEPVRGDDFGPATLVLVPLASHVPASVRVAQLLKRALRDYGLRCTCIRTPTAPELVAAE